MWTRKQFLRAMVDGGAATLGLALLGCGTPPQTGPDASTVLPTGDARETGSADDGGLVDAGPPGTDAGAGRCVQNGTTVVIGANHGHVLVVTREDVAAGIAKTYDIQGTSDHPHTVTITAAMFAQLAQGTTITTTSSFDAGHDHPITVACA